MSRARYRMHDKMYCNVGGIRQQRQQFLAVTGKYDKMSKCRKSLDTHGALKVQSFRCRVI